MHISTQKPSAPQSFGRKFYLAVASLILLGIVIQGVLIGPSLFTGTTWGQAVHANLGYVILLLTLLLPVISGLSHLPGRMTLLSGVLAGLALLAITSASLGATTVLLAALHPAIALLMMALTVLLLVQGWHAQFAGEER